MDIVALIDTEGNIMVEYVYDTWGRLVSINGILKDSLGILNPIRYRGYVWDEDVSLYYLRSRMMSPQMMRFISFDGAVESSAKTMLREQSGFRYCYNAPTAYFDCDGNIALTIGCALLTIVVAGIVNVASGLISSLFTKEAPTWGSVANDFVKGASVAGATICYGPLGGAAMAGAFGAAEYAYDCAEGKASPTLDGLKDVVVTDSITQLFVGGVPAVPTSISAVKELAVDTVAGTFKEDAISTMVKSVGDALEGSKNNSGAKTVKTSSASKSNQSQTGFGSTMPYLKTVRDTATGKLKEIVVYP